MKCSYSRDKNVCPHPPMQNASHGANGKGKDWLIINYFGIMLLGDFWQKNKQINKNGFW